MKILFNFASRSRPTNFFRGVTSIINNLSGENEHHILAVLDEDDATMNNEEVIKAMETAGVDYRFGKSTGKINAINREVGKFPDFDILVNWSDDMVVVKKDFDKDIVAAMPEDLDGYLHFRDTNHKPIDALCTLHIVGKKYFSRDGFIYHPAYESVYCDNWNDDIAKKRGKYKFINEIIFDHRHCVYGKAPKDAQYEKTENKVVYRRDYLTYLKMKKNLKHYV